MTITQEMKEAGITEEVIRAYREGQKDAELSPFSVLFGCGLNTSSYPYDTDVGRAYEKGLQGEPLTIDMGQNNYQRR
jgi:hypothetical protein